MKAKENPWPSVCFYTPLAHLSATAWFLTPRTLFPRQHVFTALCTSDPCSQPCFIKKEAVPHPALRNPLAHSCSASLTSLSCSGWVLSAYLDLQGFTLGQHTVQGATVSYKIHRHHLKGRSYSNIAKMFLFKIIPVLQNNEVVMVIKW